MLYLYREDHNGRGGGGRTARGAARGARGAGRGAPSVDRTVTLPCNPLFRKKAVKQLI